MRVLRLLVLPRTGYFRHQRTVSPGYNWSGSVFSRSKFAALVVRCKVLPNSCSQHSGQKT